jgi:uncharacterized membrane protein YfcA
MTQHVTLRSSRLPAEVRRQGMAPTADAMASRISLPRTYRQLGILTTGLIVLAGYSAWLAPYMPNEHRSWIIFAIFAAALVASVVGFAFSAICGAMLFHLIDDPVQVVQIMMICSVCGQALMVWSLRRDIVWRDLAGFLTGGAVGLPLGLYVLLNTRPAVYVSAVGLVLVSYALFMVFRRPLTIRRQHVVFDAVVGFMGGITGGAGALPGMPVTIWCGFKGWSKEQQRALYQPFILAVQVAAIAAMILLGPSAGRSTSFDFLGVVYLPAMLLGANLGMAFFRRLNDRQFSLLVNLMLIVSGLALLI